MKKKYKRSKLEHIQGLDNIFSEIDVKENTIINTNNDNFKLLSLDILSDNSNLSDDSIDLNDYDLETDLDQQPIITVSNNTITVNTEDFFNCLLDIENNNNHKLLEKKKKEKEQEQDLNDDFKIQYINDMSDLINIIPEKLIVNKENHYESKKNDSSKLDNNQKSNEIQKIYNLSDTKNQDKDIKKLEINSNNNSKSNNIDNNDYNDLNLLVNNRKIQNVDHKNIDVISKQEVINNTDTHSKQEVINNTDTQSKQEVINNTDTQSKQTVINNTDTQSKQTVINNTDTQQSKQTVINNTETQPKQTINNTETQLKEIVNNTETQSKQTVINNNDTQSKQNNQHFDLKDKDIKDITTSQKNDIWGDLKTNIMTSYNYLCSESAINDYLIDNSKLKEFYNNAISNNKNKKGYIENNSIIECSDNIDYPYEVYTKLGDSEIIDPPGNYINIFLIKNLDIIKRLYIVSNSGYWILEPLENYKKLLQNHNTKQILKIYFIIIKLLYCNKHYPFDTGDCIKKYKNLIKNINLNLIINYINNDNDFKSYINNQLTSVFNISQSIDDLIDIFKKNNINKYYTNILKLKYINY